MCVRPLKLTCFLQSVSTSYRRDVAYHSDLHGIDVMQYCNTLLHQGMREVLELPKWEELAFLVAAVCHDLKHDGYTNAFHSAVKTQKALMYNDISV